jgi:hypothetical protein
MITCEEIERRYKALRDARLDLYAAAEAEALADRALRDARAAAITNGLVTGSNDTAREASARQLLAIEYGKLAECQQTAKLAHLRFDLAGYGVDEVKLLLRHTYLGYLTGEDGEE